MTNNKLIVTTSWDDGNPFDLKVANLLKKYNLKGTFYIPLSDSGNSVLDHSSIFDLSKSFEIGGHTLSHKYLTKLHLSEIRREIIQGKAELEKIIQKDLSIFAYPGGKYNKQIIKVVKEAGFKSARTISMLNFNCSDNPYEMNTTCIVSHLNNRVLLKHLLKRLNYTGFQTFMKVMNHNSNLVDFTCQLFDIFLKRTKPSIFHIWGHSWELEKYNLWKDVELIFKYISNRPNIEYISNSQLLELN